MGRFVRCALAWTAFAAVAEVAPAQVRAHAGSPEAIVELRILRGPTGVIDALMLDSTLFISVQQFQELAEVRTTGVVPGSRLAGVMEPAGTRVVVDTERERLERGDSVFAFAPAAAIWRGERLYVTPELMSRAFAIIVSVDWEDLLVMVRNADHLPAVRRFERLRRRASIAQVAPERRIPPDLPTRRRAAGGAVLDWALTSATRDPLGTSSLDLGFGTHVLGGSAAIAYRHTNASGTRVTYAEASWSKAWSHRSWLRQIWIGDGFSTGRDPRRMRGMRLSNAPFQRSSDFAREWFRGSISPGWEIELHQSDRLLAFAFPDNSNHFAFEVPLRYGLNLLELVAYGPAGEVRHHRHAIMIPPDRLPRGEFEYGLAAGLCTTDRCSATANLDLRYGLSSHFTVQAGSDFTWRDTLPHLWSPYARLSAAATRSLGFALEVVGNGFVSGRIQYTPNPDFEASLTHVDFGLGRAVPSPWATHLRRQTQGFLFWRPSPHGAGTFFRLTAQLTETHNRRSDAIRLSSRSRLAGTLVEMGLERRRDRMERAPQRVANSVDVAATSVLVGPTPWLRSTVVRGELAAQLQSGLSLLAGGVARRLTDNFRVELKASWRRGTQGLAIDLTVVTALPTFRATSRNTFSPETGVQGIQSLEGSALWDGDAGRVTFTDGRSVGRAGLAGDVFLDENGNGRRDSNERGMPDLRVRVGPKAVMTDSLGRFATWDLMPFEPLPVAIDTLSIRNPLWVPAMTHANVVPHPNSFSVIELPLVRAAELRGRVVLGPEERPLGGLTLVLRDARTNTSRVVTSFSDGAFFFHGLRPGSYELTVAAQQLEQLGARFAATTVTVMQPEAQQDTDSLLVRLRRR